jgi:hypothetical protein
MAATSGLRWSERVGRIVIALPGGFNAPERGQQYLLSTDIN